jgi:sec-independent protein translocase protein TatC
VLIAVFVIAAIFTPPDAISQTVMAIPMYLLYEGGILFSKLMLRGRAKREQQQKSSGGNA